MELGQIANLGVVGVLAWMWYTESRKNAATMERLARATEDRAALLKALESNTRAVTELTVIIDEMRTELAKASHT